MLNSDHMFLHLITICIGLIIAFCLQQIVDLFLRRRERKQQVADAQALKSPNNTDPPAAPPTTSF